MHRPQSASSRNSKLRAKKAPLNYLQRIKTQQKDQTNKQSSFYKPSSKVVECRVADIKGYNTADINNPEMAVQFDKNVDKKLYNDKDWGRHLKKQCLCSLCTCGKHICHLHPIKLGMTLPNSTYARNFTDQGSCPNQRIRLPVHNRVEPMIVDSSNYKSQYSKKMVQLETPKKFHDNLHTGGPMTGVTTYKQNFIPKSSPSQYLQVAKGLNFPINTPMTGSSNYRDTYKWRIGRPTAVVIAPDLMPVQSNLAFLGKSSYGSDFKAPSKDQYPERVHDPRRREKSLGPSSNETTYRKEYGNSHMSMCPAQIERRRNLHSVYCE